MAPVHRPLVRSVIASAAVLLLIGAAALLYFVPPGPNSIYPRCVLYATTGIYCPGCGATRCVHALLHGDLAQAIAYNVYLVIAIPFLVVAGALAWFQAVTGRTVRIPRLPAWSIYLLFVLILAFGILRNLPFYPFNLLAPHQIG